MKECLVNLMNYNEAECHHLVDKFDTINANKLVNMSDFDTTFYF